MLKLLGLVLIAFTSLPIVADCAHEIEVDQTLKSGEWPLPFREASFPLEEVEGIWVLGEGQPLLKIEYIEFSEDENNKPYHSLMLKFLDRETGEAIASGFGKLKNNTVVSTLYFENGSDPVQLKLKSFFSGKNSLSTGEPIMVFLMKARVKGDVGEGKIYRVKHLEEDCY